ncbi:MAG: 4-(cytidine 5'-diphospho)-2-C-methyl-D-erythritol kinase [Prevotella sp.]
MITFPCAKINLGLNVISRREDGYHNLETVFYPIPLCDALEISHMDDRFPSPYACDLKVSGTDMDCPEQENLVVKAYNILAADYCLPRVHAHLHKQIPSQAGLGGGSSDAAYMLKLLDERFRLNIGNAELEKYAAQLGADCPFFIAAEPAYATGTGTELAPVDTPDGNLDGYFLAVVKADVSVSTKDAYAAITPQKPTLCCRDIVRKPIETWRELLHNDFEQPVFSRFPVLAEMKSRLYEAGAVYAQMSGSGSALFGIFRKEPSHLQQRFPGCFISVMCL